MKYMTFNSSCSYAGLANLLSFFGIDTEDKKIALEMQLPYMFDQEEGCYQAGPMLQGSKWYNLYLNPIGYAWKEQKVPQTELRAVLRRTGYAMFGIHISEKSKHAVIFTSMKGDLFSILNNKWEHSNEPNTLLLSENELLQRVDETVMVGSLQKTERHAAPRTELLRHSVCVLRMLNDEIQQFSVKEKLPVELCQSMSPLFRPILLDGITMLDLLGEAALSRKLKTVQAQLMNALKQNKPMILAQSLDLPLLTEAMTEYAALIQAQIPTHPR